MAPSSTVLEQPRTWDVRLGPYMDRRFSCRIDFQNLALVFALVTSRWKTSHCFSWKALILQKHAHRANAHYVLKRGYKAHNHLFQEQATFFTLSSSNCLQNYGYRTRVHDAQSDWSGSSIKGWTRVASQRERQMPTVRKNLRVSKMVWGWSTCYFNYRLDFAVTWTY